MSKSFFRNHFTPKQTEHKFDFESIADKRLAASLLQIFKLFVFSVAVADLDKPWHPIFKTSGVFFFF
jgi:hypothetical protein